jgi:hypothetical protein
LEIIEREREKINEKKREVAAYSQQAWRKYTHMKTQGRSLYGLPIHDFLMFNDVIFLIFLAFFCVLTFIWIDE